MNKNGQDQPRQDWQDHFTGHHLIKGGWKRIHHSWVFWVFFILTLVAITYYITSIDFAFAPREHSTPQMENNVAP